MILPFSFHPERQWHFSWRSAIFDLEVPCPSIRTISVPQGLVAPAVGAPVEPSFGVSSDHPRLQEREGNKSSSAPVLDESRALKAEKCFMFPTVRDPEGCRCRRRSGPESLRPYPGLASQVGAAIRRSALRSGGLLARRFDRSGHPSGDCAGFAMQPKPASEGRKL
jgi:hypothetical protein